MCGKLIKIALVVSLCLVPGCTTRQVYQTAVHTAPAADAINLNTAAAEELERLPRVGPKTAANIIKFRSDNGPFRNVEELMQIHGMSEKKFFEIRQYLRTE
jgi:competence ComEA-like helix-hairpin-helix protein